VSTVEIGLVGIGIAYFPKILSNLHVLAFFRVYKSQSPTNHHHHTKFNLQNANIINILALDLDLASLLLAVVYTPLVLARSLRDLTIQQAPKILLISHHSSHFISRILGERIVIHYFKLVF
jgi:hypothetical protein